MALPFGWACHFCPLSRVIEFSGRVPSAAAAEWGLRRSISISASALSEWTHDQWRKASVHWRLPLPPPVTIQPSCLVDQAALIYINSSQSPPSRPAKIPIFCQQYFSSNKIQAWIHATATHGVPPLPPAPVASRASGSRRSARWSSPPWAVAGK